MAAALLWQAAMLCVVTLVQRSVGNAAVCIVHSRIARSKCGLMGGAAPAASSRYVGVASA